MLAPDQRRQAQEIFITHGYEDMPEVARPITDDEVVFVVPTGALAGLSEAALTTDLQHALDRKVWITSASSEWPDTEPLTSPS